MQVVSRVIGGSWWTALHKNGFVRKGVVVVGSIALELAYRTRSLSSLASLVLFLVLMFALALAITIIFIARP